jgi:hypothetical protein
VRLTLVHGGGMPPNHLTGKALLAEALEIAREHLREHINHLEPDDPCYPDVLAVLHGKCPHGSRED